MKVIFFNLPAYGHVNPSLAIVKELIARGEEVVYYTSANFEATLTSLGANYRPYPISMEFDFAYLSLHLVKFSNVMMEKTLQLLPPLLDELRELQADYILHDTTCMWAKIAAQQLQIPAISTIPFFLPLGGKPKPSLWLPILKTIWRAIPDIPAFFSLAKKIKQQYGLDIRRMKDTYYNDEALNIVYTSRLLQANSERADKHFVFIGPTISGRQEMMDFPMEQLENSKVVYISLGTIMSGQQTAFYRLCFQALKTLDAVVVLAIGRETAIKTLGEIPKNFIIRHYIPQLAVLEKASIFITHVGMNSLQEGIYYETPLIMIPQTLEQQINALRAEEVGAGIYLPMEKVNVVSLRKTVDKIFLQNSYKKSLNMLKNAFITSGGAEKAVKAIRKHVLNGELKIES